MAAQQGDVLLDVEGLSKSYGAVRALEQVSVRVRKGSVHAVVGENGAGKSTLIKIISGAERADAGTLRFAGEPVTVPGTNQAMDLGIATVYQEPQLFADLTVAENIFLGREIRRGGRIDWRAQAERVQTLLDELGLPRHYARRQVGELSVAAKQQVSIAKAMAREARLLILDEPSAILTDNEIEILFDLVRRLVQRGVAVIYISHRLDELFRITDTVTVMRDGQVVGTFGTEDLSVRQIAELMVGHELDNGRTHRDPPAGEPMLSLRGLGRGEAFRDVDVDVAAGEIVALYGLVGSGADEIAATLYGIKPATAGSITIGGTPARIRSPRDAQRHRLAMLPADRKQHGVFAIQDVAFNITTGHARGFRRFGFLMDRARENRVVRELMERLAVKAPGPHTPVDALSGGNQQKVVLARQLVDRPSVLVLEEPTQGVDVGAKEEIHRLVADLAAQGTAVLVVTADLPEALRVADRIVVVRQGTTTVEFDPGARQADVLAAAAGELSQEGAG
ncbi:sugar ABC transporter ATP-binding protein [Prauserella muralis]|uniref:ABC transporter ATP-binding protein n=1 Tax=Prauserella muralis TaxID=588067 RepID=A0A2V4AQU7_9PSEU|nr:sugar ABC transporter ATP-binding protein [Prauserella muralis]PXY22414.1 ABC transporter ATP-binding protein [Prauserella muralis]TWE28081.1 monosaccharide ABC transporter ATP-binding protein (CUT2 family) [Prauserella muralis]